MASGFFIVSIIPFRTRHKNDQNVLHVYSHSVSDYFMLIGKTLGREKCCFLITPQLLKKHTVVVGPPI